MNNIQIGKETREITKAKSYEFREALVNLPDLDYASVTAISPEEGLELAAMDLMEFSECQPCKITVTNEDSFQAAHRYQRALVMNFANAHCPGGGFLLGATAQEEALCRNSTLYESLVSEEAAEMYRYNNLHVSNVESDYMLLSENVSVFRDEKCSLLEQPFLCAVITIPAPNRFGAAMFASDKKIEVTMKKRIRIMFSVAVKYGYRNLVLGAWGCGAFGNKPERVSRYFKSVLKEEGYEHCFDEVCFAVYGSENGSNINAFRKTFL